MNKKDKIRLIIKHFWTLACQHEGFPTDTTFAIFSDGNLAAKHYNRAIGVYFDLTAGKPEVAKIGFAGVR